MNYIYLHGLNLNRQRKNSKLSKYFKNEVFLEPDLYDFLDINKLRTFSTEEIADRVVDYINENKLHNIHLIGYSYGCLIVLEILKRNFTNIKQATLISPSIGKKYLQGIMRFYIRFSLSYVGKIVIKFISINPKKLFGKPTVYIANPHILFKKNISRATYDLDLDKFTFKQWIRSVQEVYIGNYDSVIIQNASKINILYAKDDNVVNAKKISGLEEFGVKNIFCINDSDHNLEENKADILADKIKSFSQED